MTEQPRRRLHRDLVIWWPSVSPPSHHVEEAQDLGDGGSAMPREGVPVAADAARHVASAVAVLAAVAPAVRRGARGTRAASWALSGIMCTNGLGHLGSLYFQRWLPATTSAPLLLVAGVLLARYTWDRPSKTSLR